MTLDPDNQNEHNQDRFDETGLFDAHEPDDWSSDIFGRQGASGYAASRRDKLVLYAVVVSLLLHALVFVVIPRMSPTAKLDSVLKPGETATRIRLTEPPPSAEDNEPPPDKPSALSDRNHRTERERIPMLPRQGPIGQMKPPGPQIAALKPPVAPEDVEEDKPEKPKEVEEPPKPREPETTARRRPTKPERKPRRNDRDAPAQSNIDLSPTIGEINRALSPGGGADFLPDGSIEEPILDMNTRHHKFASYLLHLKRKIQGVWIYPDVAAKSGLGGQLTLEFVIHRSGKLMDVRVMDSSGHSILDESAKSAVKTAAPYHAFPESWKHDRLRLRGSFIYVTRSFFRRIM